MVWRGTASLGSKMTDRCITIIVVLFSLIRSEARKLLVANNRKKMKEQSSLIFDEESFRCLENLSLWFGHCLSQSNDQRRTPIDCLLWNSSLFIARSKGDRTKWQMTFIVVALQVWAKTPYRGEPVDV